MKNEKSKRTATQCDKIIKHPLKYGSITPLDAYERFGCMRLAARISDLRERGWAIKSETEVGKNRFGEPTRYTRYILMLDEMEGVS